MQLQSICIAYIYIDIITMKKLITIYQCTWTFLYSFLLHSNVCKVFIPSHLYIDLDIIVLKIVNSIFLFSFVFKWFHIQFHLSFYSTFLFLMLLNIHTTYNIHAIIIMWSYVPPYTNVCMCRNLNCCASRIKNVSLFPM